MNLEQVLGSVPIDSQRLNVPRQLYPSINPLEALQIPFYYLWAVGGGKAIRGIGGGVSFPEVTGARQHVLAFHQAPPATCLSCQWSH